MRCITCNAAAESSQESWASALLKKMVMNIQVRFSNVSIKYVENNIALSLFCVAFNVFSTDETWKESFVVRPVHYRRTITPSNFLQESCGPASPLSRAFDAKDLTLCLDFHEPGKGMDILYQRVHNDNVGTCCDTASCCADPVVEKASVCLRTKWTTPSALRMMDVHCNKLEFKLSNCQVMLVCIHLCICVNTMDYSAEWNAEGDAGGHRWGSKWARWQSC